MNVFSCFARGLNTFHALEIVEHPERIAPSTNALVQNQSELGNSTNEKIQRIYETFASQLQNLEERIKNLSLLERIAIKVPFSLLGVSVDEGIKLVYFGSVLLDPLMRPEILPQMVDKLPFIRSLNPENAIRNISLLSLPKTHNIHWLQFPNSPSKSEVIAMVIQRAIPFIETPGNNPHNTYLIHLMFESGNNSNSNFVHVFRYLDRPGRITEEYINHLILSSGIQLKNSEQDAIDRIGSIAFTLYPGLSTDSLSVAGHTFFFSESEPSEATREKIPIELHVARISWLLRDCITPPPPCLRPLKLLQSLAKKTKVVSKKFGMS